MAFDPYWNMTEDVIFDKILNSVHTGCIRNHGGNFELSNLCNFTFYEHYSLRKGVLSDTWHLESEPAGNQAALLIGRANAAICRLPHGIVAEIITKRIDPRSHPTFKSTRAQVDVCYTLNVNVCSAYAQHYYSHLCEGIIVHDPNIREDFRRNAHAFYCRLKERHLETIDRIASDVAENFTRYYWDGFHFYAYLDKIERAEYEKWPYEKYGMKPLPDMACAYGMAMALIESLTKNAATENRYTLSVWKYFVAVDKLPALPQKLNDW